MTQYIPFTDEQLKALGDMYLAGQSTHRLAKRYGISPTTVMRRLLARGITLRPLRENRVATDEVLATAQRMREEGKAWRHIEKATGVLPRSIMGAMRRKRRQDSAQ